MINKDIGQYFSGYHQLWKKGIIRFLLGLMLLNLVFGQVRIANAGKEQAAGNDERFSAVQAEVQASSPESLIRFHVVANSDSAADQALKRAVRDRILSEVSPRLAASQSLAESRQMLQQLMPQMEGLAQKVIREWGQGYGVKAEYGHFLFPTKSYGSLVLPAGDYEAVKILIGKGEGSNWWCVLFPPLCFVDIEHSTAVPVDGKPGIPIQKNPKDGHPVVKFWFWEKVKEILNRV